MTVAARARDLAAATCTSVCAHVGGGANSRSSRHAGRERCGPTASARRRTAERDANRQGAALRSTRRDIARYPAGVGRVQVDVRRGGFYERGRYSGGGSVRQRRTGPAGTEEGEKGGRCCGDVGPAEAAGPFVRSSRRIAASGADGSGAPVRRLAAHRVALATISPNRGDDDACGDDSRDRRDRVRTSCATGCRPAQIGRAHV